MIKRTIEISQRGLGLSLRLQQLVLRNDNEQIASIPCEDIGVLLVDHPAAHFTHAALTGLADSGAVVILCGTNHLPSAILMPLSQHSELVPRIAHQLNAPQPLKKQLWKQIIQAKIQAQAGILQAASPAAIKLRALAATVRSGDPSNVEAHAAKVYWRHWLSDDEHFRRDRESDGLNSLLNYGYAVLRAAVARAIVASGLLPAVGIHHHHRSNAYCLADDLMEPLRPLVDDRARELYREGSSELNQATKARLLSILEDRVEMAGETGPLLVALHRYSASLVRCFQRETRRLDIPRPC